MRGGPESGRRELSAAVVEAVCLSTPGVRVAKQPCNEALLGPHGFVGDRHEAEFRANRFGGPPRKNRRQWSALSSDEVAELCADLGLDRPFQPGVLGENLMLSGVQLAFVPEESVIEFPGGARLLVNGCNDPCVNAAAELSRTYGADVEDRFIKTAFGRRGIIGSVLESGVIRPGERVRILVPEPAGRARI